MINPKQITRKKSQNLISVKPAEGQLKRKKSVSNLVISSKHKKQGQKQDKKVKQDKKQLHSLSKGKISKKPVKCQKTDQNINTLNHKKSLQRFQTMKGSKQMKTKRVSEENYNQKRQQKSKHLQTEHTLSKVGSQVRVQTKKVIKKKVTECKQAPQQKYLKQYQTIEQCKVLGKKEQGLSRNPTSKKTLLQGTKSKLKKPQSSTIQQQSIQTRKSTKPKLKNKISEIIQKSFLYSDVNYEFKQQISLLGSGIKREEEFFLEWRDREDFGEKRDVRGMDVRRGDFIDRENRAAITIQRHYRGYIQRKYIEEARMIIESVKKIQRFWRSCLQKKRMKQKPFNKANIVDLQKAQNSTSLITIKDLNDTAKLQKKPVPESLQCQLSKRASQQQVNKNTLKDIIKELMIEQRLKESIKEKIWQTIVNDQKLFNEQNPIQPVQKPSKPFKTELTITPLQHTPHIQKTSYVQMQINSERYFNSPMNNSRLESPGIKRLVSPKCLSGKELKTNYNNYFRSNKNVFSSPKSDGRSHSGSKKQNVMEPINYGGSTSGKKEQKRVEQHCSVKLSLPRELEQCFANGNAMTKDDYLLHSEITVNSPIDTKQQTSDINLLQSQKIPSAQLFAEQDQQTRRTPKSPQVRPFPTEFAFIEEFCLLIVDYLRDDQQTSEVFMEKMKGLKFYKIEKVFKDWEKLQFEEYFEENKMFGLMLSKESCERPTILSNTEKKMVIEYPSLRLFLNQNDYPDQQIFTSTSPQSAYITFMFDVFQQCIYSNFNSVTLDNLHLFTYKQASPRIDYMSEILSKTMMAMMTSAQMLCGSFVGDYMTEVEKEERAVMNQMRLQEMIKEWCGEWADRVDSCEMWIKMIVGNMVVQHVIGEVLGQMSTLMS